MALSYKNGAKRITTRLPVVDLAVEGENMFSLGETFEILLEAHNKKGEIVGEAKRGGLVDVATGTVTVKPGRQGPGHRENGPGVRGQVHGEGAEPHDLGAVRLAGAGDRLCCLST